MIFYHSMILSFYDDNDDDDDDDDDDRNNFEDGIIESQTIELISSI